MHQVLFNASLKKGQSLHHFDNVWTLSLIAKPDEMDELQKQQDQEHLGCYVCRVELELG